jgi:hypothetical protein
LSLITYRARNQSIIVALPCETGTLVYKCSYYMYVPYRLVLNKACVQSWVLDRAHTSSFANGSSGLLHGGRSFDQQRQLCTTLRFTSNSWYHDQYARLSSNFLPRDCKGKLEAVDELCNESMYLHETVFSTGMSKVSCQMVLETYANLQPMQLFRPPPKLILVPSRTFG